VVTRPAFEPSGVVVGSEEALRITRAAKAVSQAAVDKKAEVLVIPEPEVRAHPVDWTDKASWPQGARTIGNLATKQGFQVSASHARGPWIGDTPLRVLRICDSLLLRMRHDDGRRASALWLTDAHGDWGLECAFVLTPWLQMVKSAPFKDYLKTPRVDEPETSEAVTDDAVVDLDAYDVP
jgi:hypothetical protein